MINSDVNSILCTQGENVLERKCYKVDIHCFHTLFVKVILSEFIFMYCYTRNVESNIKSEKF